MAKRIPMANLGKVDWKVKTCFSSFGNLSQHSFESKFYIKTKQNKTHVNLRDSVLWFPFSPPLSWKYFILQDSPCPRFGAWCNFSLRLLKEHWMLGWTSISVEMMMLESNFQSFLNFFFIGSLNGLLYSFAVGPSIRHLFCWHVNALLSKINHTASSQAGCHLR